MNTALVTGSAGFIGYHVARRWLDEGWRVVGLDAFTDYYDPKLKRDRAAMLSEYPDYFEVEQRIEDPGVLNGLFSDHSFDQVIHLAAQAGVRHSIDAPRSYVTANLLGTFELLEAARAYPGARLLLASTSSVYGANDELPYRETEKADSPMSFYAATKKSTEAMAHAYSHLYDVPTIMFRFFTVYGPWGRPDMALFKFVKAILENHPIEVYNHGKMQRDFTYIDDLVEAIWRLSTSPLDRPKDRNEIQRGDSLSPVAPYRVVNIGKSSPDQLIDFIDEIEKVLGKKASKKFMDRQMGDVLSTGSQTSLLEALTGFRAETTIEMGIPEFVTWYRNYYRI